MTTINVHEAKTHLSRYLARVEEGEEIIIARAGKPVARLLPVDRETSRRRFGADHGLFEVPDDFDAPLPEELLDEFER